MYIVMGHLVVDGLPLDWAEIEPISDRIRQRGIEHFLAVYSTSRPEDGILWGDELEFMILEFNGSWRLDVDAVRSIKRLKQEEQIMKNLNRQSVGGWNYEFGSYMIESIPLAPYSENDLLSVEESMASRRRALEREFPGQLILSMSVFPLMGVGEPICNNGITKSNYVDDSFVNQEHPRFASLAKNIRARRNGEKVSISLPVYQDVNTVAQTVHMDAMTFGMGCCCLQLTFQTKNVVEAKRLFDQFVPLAPIALALSAASPVFRGLLTTKDTRWSVVSASVDDRRKEELDPDGPNFISKSRYASISRYLEHPQCNDIDLRYNDCVLKQLEGRLDDGLRYHLAHLFVRDPLTFYLQSNHDIEQVLSDPQSAMECFENIQSTNWQTVRFKPPTSHRDGWRVEFRPMDIQLDDRMNAALAIWIFLYSQMVMRMEDFEVCIPISLVDENMHRAEKMNAVINGKFWFNLDGVLGEYSVLEIVTWLNDQMAVSDDSVCEYLKLISDRASGTLETDARVFRKFIASHPDYNHDSVLTDQIFNDYIARIGKQ